MNTDNQKYSGKSQQSVHHHSFTIAGVDA
jgi:hypothetical protein